MNIMSRRDGGDSVDNESGGLSGIISVYMYINVWLLKTHLTV